MDKLQQLSASVSVSADGRVIISDMDLAIYCHWQHRIGKIVMPVVDVIEVSRYKHLFTFEDPNKIVRQVEMDFANSLEASGFADAQRSLKTIKRQLLRARQYNERDYQG